MWVIHNNIMYDMAKPCVKNGAEISDFFACRNVVIQGENLSALLFGIFLNDLIQYISSRYQGLIILSTVTHEMLSDETIGVYIKKKNSISYYMPMIL